MWSSRTHGWLELGFDSAYFDRALALTGWSGRRLRLGAGAGETDVIVARAASATAEPRPSHCGAKKLGSVPLGTLAPLVRASCRWPSSIQ